MKRIVLILALVSTLVPAVSQSSVDSPADVWRRRVAAAARQAGVDPAEVLASEISLRLPGRDGALVPRTQTLDQWFGTLGRMAAPGVGGLPEITAGDFLHIYVSAGFDVDPGYNVTESAIVPATPPIDPPSPANFLVWDAGGPLTQVKGSYLQGIHDVGTVYGSNIDTAESGPYLPVVHSGAVTDTSIDFIGHVDSIEQEGACFLDICFAWIGILVADGLVIWDTADPSVPIVP